MLGHVIVFSVVILSSWCSLLAQQTSSVEWGKPVTFADFEAQPDEQDTAAASISVTIVLGYTANRYGTLRFQVSAVMDKDLSWIKKEFSTQEILHHEQGHFDIAHIYAKKLEKELLGRRYTNKDVRRLHEVYDHYLEQMHAVQTQYDKDTAGGLIAEAQVRWRKFIDEEID